MNDDPINAKMINVNVRRLASFFLSWASEIRPLSQQKRLDDLAAALNKWLAEESGAKTS